MSHEKLRKILLYMKYLMFLLEHELLEPGVKNKAVKIGKPKRKAKR